MKREFLRLTLALTAVTAATALLLGAANAVTAERIAQRQEEARRAAMQAVLPDARDFEPLSGAPDAVRAVYAARSGGTLCGYVVETAASGFGGEIAVTVGVLPDGTVAGVEITSHAETAGLGARCTENGFLSQFAGLSAGFGVSKTGASGNAIDAISGATVTSKAVAGAVNAAIGAAAQMGGLS